MQQLAQALSDLAHGERLAPRDVHDEWRRARVREAAQRPVVRVALPDDVDVPHAQIDRLLSQHARRDVHEHAVAEIDGVVEAHDRHASATSRGRVLEDALAAEA